MPGAYAASRSRSATSSAGVARGSRDLNDSHRTISFCTKWYNTAVALPSGPLGACVGEYTVSYVVGLSVCVNLLLQWVFWRITDPDEPEMHKRRPWWDRWKRRGGSGDQ